MTHERQQYAGQEDECVEQVDERNDEIDTDKKRRELRFFPYQMAMPLQTFDHAARPTFALAIKTVKRRRRGGKADRCRFEANPPTVSDQGPSQHDIFAYDGRPALMSFDNLATKSAERALCD